MIPACSSSSVHRLMPLSSELTIKTYHPVITSSDMNYQYRIRKLVISKILCCFFFFTHRRVLAVCLTLPPGDSERNPRALMEFWNRFNAAFLQDRRNGLVGWLRVLEARADGTLHLHLLLVTTADVVRPTYPSQFSQRYTNPRCLNDIGRALRDEVNRHAVRVGFGVQSEISPLKKVPVALAKYYAKAFSRSEMWKHPHLHGTRRFAMSTSLKRELRLRQSRLFKGAKSKPKVVAGSGSSSPVLSNGPTDDERINFGLKKALAKAQGVSWGAKRVKRAGKRVIRRARGIWIGSPKWHLHPSVPEIHFPLPPGIQKSTHS